MTTISPSKPLAELQVEVIPFTPGDFHAYDYDNMLVDMDETQRAIITLPDGRRLLFDCNAGMPHGGGKVIGWAQVHLMPPKEMI